MKIKNKLVGHFRVSEFLKYDNSPNASTFAKIFVWIDILNDARKKLCELRDEDSPIIINSASRCLLHEKLNKRSGRSQHVFKNHKGAVDITCSGNIAELYEILLKDDRISRVCIYEKENFIHIDMLPSSHKKYKYSDSLKGWARV